MQKVRKIAILGPESTGKSVLTRFLAQHFDEPFVPEYAREYLRDLNYDERDLLSILHTQGKQQDEATKQASKYVFYDTEAIIIKIWSQVVFNKVDPAIQSRINQQQIDLYLLTFYDLPWEPDKLREGRKSRKSLFSLYQDELEKNGFGYCVIRGEFFDRAFQAIKEIEKL